MSREEEIRARLEAATPGWQLDGPWHHEFDPPEETTDLTEMISAGISRTAVLIAPPLGESGGRESRRADVDLAVHAPGDLTWLLREVERLRALLSQVEPILSLLEHRGLVDSELNRQDVAAAADALRRTLAGGDQ